MSQTLLKSDPAARPWSVDRGGRLLAGLTLLVLAALALSTPRWLWGVLGLGLHLTISSIVDCCPVHDVLLKLGWREREDLFLPGGSPRQGVQS
ncbi:MAG: YgaP-like transmembrane domain [Gemmataceae bacterium]